MITTDIRHTVNEYEGEEQIIVYLRNFVFFFLLQKSHLEPYNYI